MYRVLFLDDKKERHQAIAMKLNAADVVHVYTAEDAISALEHQIRSFDQVWLDHDLGTELDGKDVARYIAGMDRYDRPGRVFVHSNNPPGAEAIVAIIRSAGIPVERVSL